MKRYLLLTALLVGCSKSRTLDVNLTDGLKGDTNRTAKAMLGVQF